MVEEYQETGVSVEVIQKKYARGMTIEQIAVLYGLESSYVESKVDGVSVTQRKKLIAEESQRLGLKPKARQERLFMRPKRPIDYVYVEKLVDEGLNLKQLASAVGFSYSTFIGRIAEERPDLHQRASYKRTE